MNRIRLLITATGLTCLFAIGLAIADEPGDVVIALRKDVLKATSAYQKSESYKDYFLKVGRRGLAELTKDADTGIALQAAWEVHKKVVDRPQEIEFRSDRVYDRDEVAKFLSILKDRVKVPVPGWWAESIVDVDVYEEAGHGFNGKFGSVAASLHEAKASKNLYVPQGAELERNEETLLYYVGRRTVGFPANTFDHGLNDAYAALAGKKRSIVVGYCTSGGFPFQIAGFEEKGGKPMWKVGVWGAGRTFLAGCALHRVELVKREETVFVFGAEGGGMYLEAFDIATGKCQFRFCTGYWFNFSESWGLK